MNGYDFAYLLLLQGIIGLWQLGSAFFIVNHKETQTPDSYRRAKIYLKWACINIVFGLLLGFCSFLLAGVWIYVIWWLNIYYCIYTVKSAFCETPKRKTFMDILN